MVVLEIVHLIDKTFTRLSGFASPWVKYTSTTSILGYLHSFILVAILPITAFFAPALKPLISNWLQYLRLLYTALVVIDTYTIIFLYNKINNRCAEFSKKFFENDAYLDCVTISVADKTTVAKMVKYYLMLITSLFGVAVAVVLIFKTNTILAIAVSLCRIMSCPIVLQWSLCMYDVERYLSKGIEFITTKIVSNTLEVDNQALSGNVVPQKRIDIKVFDVFIKFYRLVAEKHRLANEYYGFHICFNISVRIYGLVAITYNFWRSKSKGIDNFLQPLVIINHLLTVLLISVVSRSLTRKVSLCTFLIIYKIN